MGTVTVRNLPLGTVEDEFIASHLGRPVWRMDCTRAGSPREVVRAAKRSSVGLMSCRIEASNDHAAGELAEAGFRPVGRLITFRLSLDSAPARLPDGRVRDGLETDAAACREIARTSFTTDRFHADPSFPNYVADNLKVAWVNNAFAGRADHILVCDREGGAVGFDLCLWRPPVAVIDLIAVAADARGQGAATALIAAMAVLARKEGLEAIEAGTQETNRSACALYRRLDFAAVRTRIDFHWTPDPG